MRPISGPQDPEKEPSQTLQVVVSLVGIFY